MLKNTAALFLGSGASAVIVGGVLVVQLVAATPAATQASSPLGGTQQTAAQKDKPKDKPKPNPGHPIDVTWVIDRPLVPGGTSTMTTTVDNPNNQAIKITNVSAVVTGVDKVGCDADFVTVAPFTGTPAWTIPANTDDDLDMAIMMAENGQNQDACKGAKFAITVTAKAEPA